MANNETIAKKRLRAAEAEKSSAVGDAAKLREALKLCMDEMCNRCRELATARGNPLSCLQGCEPVRKAKAALAAPPRNCDVGTEEEQEVRFRNYCWNHSSRDKNMECQCPIDAEGKAGCKLTWAQLPYEEGGNDGK